MTEAMRTGRYRGLAGTPWTPGEREQAIRLRQAGLTCRQIGEQIGRSFRSVEGALQRAGCRLSEEALRQIKHTWGEEEQAKLGELLPTGLTYDEMARRIGRSKATVWRKAAKMRELDPTLPSVQRRRRWTPEEKDLLVQLHAREWSPERIAKRLHRTPGAVRAALAKRRKAIAQDPKLRMVAGVVEFCLNPMRVLQAAREAGIVPELTEADTSEKLAALITQVRGGW
ncbi:MAG: hypothetical protein QME79_12185 [Bacillota bacterium]|nr:hypothetical protein [Bacillota bacterium]